jgi:hypothetical protein
MVNQSLVRRINPESIRDGKIATFAKPETVSSHCRATRKRHKKTIDSLK